MVVLRSTKPHADTYVSSPPKIVHSLYFVSMLRFLEREADSVMTILKRFSYPFEVSHELCRRLFKFNRHCLSSPRPTHAVSAPWVPVVIYLVCKVPLMSYSNRRIDLGKESIEDLTSRLKSILVPIAAVPFVLGKPKGIGLREWYQTEFMIYTPQILRARVQTLDNRTQKLNHDSKPLYVIQAAVNARASFTRSSFR